MGLTSYLDRASQVLVKRARAGSEKNYEAARACATEIPRLRAGTNFKLAAAEYSDGSD